MTHITPLTMLAAPTVPQAHKQGINAQAATHLQVDIAPYPDMGKGDLIELFWNNCFAASKRVGAADIGLTSHLRVPESFVQNGAARIHYRVMQVGRGPARSMITRVQVKTACPGGQPSVLCAEENQNLAPVALPETIRRHGVNPSQIRRGVPLTIEPYLNMAAGDAITLRWGDARLDLPPIQATEVGRPVQVWVPSALILEAGDDARQEVTYCVIDRVGNNSRWAPGRIVSIAQANATGAADALSVYQPRRPGSPCEPG
ncbi:MAG: Molecular chaperone [Pseudomonas shahriarae]|jgi:hypothetical protein|uniref:hypothetical protein n=1 Tax=Pseudomonas shahriarae TaxID=2745512 RepID=UPI003A0FBA9C